MAGFLLSLTDTALLIQFCFAVISLASCIFTIIIIFGLEARNGYLQLIQHLTISQGIYDLSLLLGVFSNYQILQAAYFFRLAFGVSTTLFTNVISFVVLYVVFYLKSFDVKRNLLGITVFIYLFSLPFGILTDVPDQTTEDRINFTYNIVRVASILINVIFYLMLTVKVRQMSLTGIDPLSILVGRLKYYPLIQVLTRIPATWYEMQFGQDVDYDSSYSMFQKVLLLIDSVTKPSAGLAFFFVFLYITPAARPQVRKMYRQFLRFFCCCFSPGKETDTSLSSYLHQHEYSDPPVIKRPKQPQKQQQQQQQQLQPNSEQITSFHPVTSPFSTPASSRPSSVDPLPLPLPSDPQFGLASDSSHLHSPLSISLPLPHGLRSSSVESTPNNDSTSSYPPPSPLSPSTILFNHPSSSPQTRSPLVARSPPSTDSQLSASSSSSGVPSSGLISNSSFPLSFSTTSTKNISSFFSPLGGRNHLAHGGIGGGGFDRENGERERDSRSSDMTVYEDMGEDELGEHIERIYHGGPGGGGGSIAIGGMGFFQSFQTQWGQKSTSHYSPQNFQAHHPSRSPSQPDSHSSSASTSAPGTPTSSHFSMSPPTSPSTPQGNPTGRTSFGAGFLTLLRPSNSSRDQTRSSEVNLTTLRTSSQANIPGSIQHDQRRIN